MAIFCWLLHMWKTPIASIKGYLLFESPYSSPLIDLSFPSVHLQHNRPLVEKKQVRIGLKDSRLAVSTWNLQSSTQCTQRKWLKKWVMCEIRSHIFFFLKCLEVQHRNLNLCRIKRPFTACMSYCKTNKKQQQHFQPCFRRSNSSFFIFDKW